MEKNKVSNLLVLGSKWLFVAQIFLVIGSIGCGVFQRTVNDGGIFMAICLGLALIFEANAYHMLAEADWITMDDPDNTFKVRYFCFETAYWVQLASLLCYVAFAVIMFRQQAYGGSKGLVFAIVAICILTVIKVYHVCLGFIGFAAEKSGRLAKLFEIGSVVVPICELGLLAAYILYKKTDYPVSIILSMTVIGLIGMAFFIVLLGAFITKIRDGASHGREIRKAVFVMLFLMIGSFVIGTLAVTGICIGCIRAEKKAAVKYLEENMTEVMEGHNENKNRDYTIVKSRIEDIEDTGYYSVPAFENRGRPDAFCFPDMYKRFGYTINVYTFINETGEKMLAVMPSFMFEKVKKEAADGVITFPVALYEKFYNDNYSLVYRDLPDLKSIAEETGADRETALFCIGFNIAFELGHITADHVKAFWNITACFFVLVIAGIQTVAHIYARRTEDKWKDQDSRDEEAENKKRRKPDKDRTKIVLRTSLILGGLIVLLALPIAIERTEYTRIHNGWIQRLTYDENGDLIYRKTANWLYYRDFDEDGRTIYVEENGELVFKWYEGRLIYSYEKDTGEWTKYTYDEKGKLTERLYSDGDRITYKNEYDKQGNLIRVEGSNGTWKNYEYDEKGNLTYSEDHAGNWEKHEYDEAGNEIYKVNDKGEWVDYEYDEKGNMTVEKKSRWREEYQYDEAGRKINVKTYMDDHLQNEIWYEYDKMGNVKYEKDRNGNHTKYINKYLK